MRSEEAIETKKVNARGLFSIALQLRPAAESFAKVCGPILNVLPPHSCMHKLKYVFVLNRSLHP